MKAMSNDALTDFASTILASRNLPSLGYQKGGWSQSDYSRFAYASGLQSEGSYRNLAAKANNLSFDFDYVLPRSLFERLWRWRIWR
jgi:hypothetical protein